MSTKRQATEARATPRNGIAIRDGIRLSWPKFLLLLLVASACCVELYPRGLALLADAVAFLQRHTPGA